MTVAKSWDLQVDVFAAVTAAVASYDLPVFDYAPTPPPGEFIRLEGFTASGMDRKRGRIARHAFEVHHFVRSAPGEDASRGQKRCKQVLAVIDVAIMAAQLQGASATHEFTSVDTDIDGVTAHGMSRYTIVLV